MKRFLLFGIRFSILVLILSGGCSTLATRPTQEMSYTSSALKSAKEVQADVLAPELYRQANEWFMKARSEFRFKNFDLALKYAKKSRNYAEEAEFEAIRAGATRNDSPIADPMSAETSRPPSP